MNSSTGKEERVGRMLLMHANDREDIKSASTGDIVATCWLKTNHYRAHFVVIHLTKLF